MKYHPQGFKVKKKTPKKMVGEGRAPFPLDSRRGRRHSPTTTLINLPHAMPSRRRGHFRHAWNDSSFCEALYVSILVLVFFSIKAHAVPPRLISVEELLFFTLELFFLRMLSPQKGRLHNVNSAAHKPLCPSPAANIISLTCASRHRVLRLPADHQCPF